MKIQPKVSIITPVYNRQEFIRETLECILTINYENWECIVMDDESTDNTAQIVKEIAQKDNRIKYFVQKKSSIPVTKNNAIYYSTGKYILPLDSDDLISTDYVKEAVEILEKRSEVKIVYCQGEFFGAKKGKWKLPDYSFSELLLSNCIHNSAIFRKSDFEHVGGYKANMFASEEWDLWVNMLKDGGEVYRIEKTYFFYRKHADSIMLKVKDRRPEMRMLMYNNNKDLYASMLQNPIQLLLEHKKFKKSYNLVRRLTFRKPLP